MEDKVCLLLLGTKSRAHGGNLIVFGGSPSYSMRGRVGIEI